MIYLFDVDGTLTPSREPMDEEFANWFEHFATHNSVCLVTGSDREKTLEQIPKSIYNLCMKVYQNCGNEVWVQDRLIKENYFLLDSTVLNVLHYWLKASQFKHRTGNHIDVRSGLVNFSVLGRNATKEQRKDYVRWDEATSERHTIAWTLNDAFGHKYNFEIAGETGIDITEKGMGKDQIIKDFKGRRVIFFGDKMDPGGNDHSLSKLVDVAMHVKDWRDTWERLRIEW